MTEKSEDQVIWICSKCGWSGEKEDVERVCADHLESLTCFVPHSEHSKPKESLTVGGIEYVADPNVHKTTSYFNSFRDLDEESLHQISLKPQSPNPLDELYMLPVVKMSKEELYGISVHFKNIMDMAINAESSKIINYLHDNQLYDESVQPQSPKPLDFMKSFNEDWDTSQMDEVEDYISLKYSRMGKGEPLTYSEGVRHAYKQVLDKIRSLRAKIRSLRSE